MQTRVVFGPTGKGKYPDGLNKSDLAYWGVDCADYCPRVCQFHFFSAHDCQNNITHLNGKNNTPSYEIHGNPWGDINRTARYQYYKKMIWNNEDPKWKSVHINRDFCNVKIPEIGVNGEELHTSEGTYGQNGPGCHDILGKHWSVKIGWQSQQPCDPPKTTAKNKDYYGTKAPKPSNTDSKIVKLVR